jgi:PKD repeat protein
MKNRIFSVILLLVLMVTMTGNAQAISPASLDQRALVYVKLGSPDNLSRFASTRLPMYAMLDGGLLTGADLIGQQMLQAAGLAYQVVDPDIRSGSYYLAESRSSRPIPNFALYGQVLLDTTNGVLLRMDPSQVNAITLAGAELRLITLDPKPYPSAQEEDIFPQVINPDPLIQSMIDQVTTQNVSDYDRQLAGELPVWVDGEEYTITSRYTYSGEPIQKATSFVGQHMANDLKMDVEYHTWGGANYPNVIGEIPGLVNPEDIFIIGAHIDDVSGAPGADDNGSGSVATLLAADILSQYQWGCTLRFAFWTGEEQGLLGSDAYALRSANLGENIVGYLNLDMIAWNTIGSSPGIDLLYNPNMPSTLTLAQLFTDVVDAYNIDLIPQLVTSLGGGSDHSSFWDQGYTAILSIEDQGDFNPYYHSSQDTPAHTDLPYFTKFVKASIATYAHMSNCLIPSGLGSLDGHVTTSNGMIPIENAVVNAEDGPGHSFSSITNDTGYYSRTLMEGTYTVTASAYSYIPITIGEVPIISGTTTTRDFDLTLAPTYTVSGTVTELGTGAPLYAMIEFTGSPATVWTDPDTGFYQAELPEDNYTMQVSSSLHRPQTRNIVLDQDQTQDFALEPLPCILLVDDDNDSPNTTPYYTAALNALGYDYDLFNTGGADGPDLNNLQGYNMVLWYSGDAYGGSAGPNTSDESNLTAYLENGGKLFLDSQDYLYDMGLTTFGQNYLGVDSYNDDSGNAIVKYGVTGDPIGDGLGPYPLTYPSGFTDYGDTVNAGAGASVAFRSSPSGGNNLDIDKNVGDWRTVFFGTSWVPIYNNNAAHGREVLQRTIDWFGGCHPPIGWLEGYVTDANTLEPLANVTISTNEYITTTKITGYYTMTLPVGDYVVTASLAGYLPKSESVTIITNQVTTQDFALVPISCDPVSGLDFTWTPSEPFNGEWVTFTGNSEGSEPITYTWDFGDDSFGTGITSTHTYAEDGDYAVVMTATNDCGVDSIDQIITVAQACDPVTQADFNWEPLNPISGGLITFTGFSEGSEPITYAWDFGDGFLGTGITITHTYAEDGDFTVIMTATNACGEDSAAQLITISQACEPVDLSNFNWLPLAPASGELVTFSGSSAGSQPITYTWYFGDNTVGAGITTNHTYMVDGDYTVVMTATNACGEDSAEHSLTIFPVCEPVAGLDFSWIPTDPFNGDLITFTAIAAGTTPIDFQWNFDDGITFTGMIVNHTYLDAATHTVELSAINACSIDKVRIIKDIPILQQIFRFFIPLLGKNY